MILKEKCLNRVTQLSLITVFTLLNILLVNGQTQKGTDIDGEYAEDRSGWDVSMPDANTLAIGTPANDGNGSNAGHVRIYTWSGTTWIQKGEDIDGEAAGDSSGSRVSMPDANTIAISSTSNSDNGSNAGHVRIYQWNGSTWIQKGEKINGVEEWDQFGRSVSMPDANTVAIGALEHYILGDSPGYVRIYKWDGSAWVQKGEDIEGEALGDWSGVSISMPDANTVAIGSIWNDGNGNASGHVRIYEWNTSTWIQKGDDIDGEAANDWSGYSVSMPDDNTVAIGAIQNSSNAQHKGHVRIYTWNGTDWTQKGTDIDGEAANDWSGTSVSMPDANTVAIGAPRNDGNGNASGHVRVYGWDGTVWIQIGTDIDGEYAEDNSGGAVSMPNANTVAIGAQWNDGNGFASGHVRVYSLCDVDVSVVNADNTLTATTAGATYQWVDCDSSYDPILGETSQTFTATTGGNYAVVITKDGCIGTSTCFPISFLSTEKIISEECSLIIYPNPSDGTFTLEFITEVIKNLPYTVSDATGKVILQGILSTDKTKTLDLKHTENGVYFLSINEQVTRLVKE